MKIELFAAVSGGDNAGWYQRDVDWPAVPRVGEAITATEGGTVTLTVDQVGYFWDGTPAVWTKPVDAKWAIEPTNLAEHGWQRLPSDA